MALFYDWLFYDGERDNIMTIVMYHSMRPHPAITATLLDFLCRIIRNFYPPMALTVSSLLIQEYTPRKWRPLHWLSWLVTYLGVVFVMVAHGHYTLDVLFAYYVTTRVFWMYHTMACNTILKQNGPSNYFSRLWWYRIFSYFERNVGGVVPRRYEWPLPWPRHFLSKYPARNCVF